MKQEFEIWLRNHVFSVEAEHVRGVFRPVNLVSPELTVKATIWDEHETPKEAAEYIARRQELFLDHGAQVTVTALPLKIASDAFVVDVHVPNAPEGPVWLLSTYRRLDSGAILQVATHTNVAGPDGADLRARVIRLAQSATVRRPETAETIGSGWCCFGDFWLEVPPEYSLPQFVRIDQEWRAPFYEETLDFVGVDAPLLEEPREPRRVALFRQDYGPRGSVEASSIEHWKLPQGEVSVQSFVMRGLTIDDEPEEDYQVYIRALLRFSGSLCSRLSFLAQFSPDNDRPKIFELRRDEIIEALRTLRVRPRGG